MHVPTSLTPCSVCIDARSTSSDLSKLVGWTSIDIAVAGIPKLLLTRSASPGEILTVGLVLDVQACSEAA